MEASTSSETGRTAKRAGFPAGLLVKNVLFWGSIALSLYGLYRLAVWLIA